MPWLLIRENPQAGSTRFQVLLTLLARVLQVLWARQMLPALEMPQTPQAWHAAPLRCPASLVLFAGTKPRTLPTNGLRAMSERVKSSCVDYPMQ